MEAPDLAYRHGRMLWRYRDFPQRQAMHLHFLRLLVDPELDDHKCTLTCVAECTTRS